MESHATTCWVMGGEGIALGRAGPWACARGRACERERACVGERVGVGVQVRARA